MAAVTRVTFLTLTYLIVLPCFTGIVFGHTTNTGLAVISIERGKINYRLTLALPELPPETARELRLATDGNQGAALRISQMLRERVRFAVNASPCAPGRVRLQGSAAGDDRAVLELQATCPAESGKFQLVDELAVPFGEHYRTIASIVIDNDSRQERVFQAGETAYAVEMGEVPVSGWLGFLRLGIGHILTGYDHLLFLLALLIGSTSVGSVLGIVTAFTVAHSITVSVAGFGLLTIPAGIIEPTIAASIVYVALENVFRGSGRAYRWVVTFLFGLVHGFGFAGALSAIDLTGWPFVSALVGFNLGVEVGQAAAVLMAAPLLLSLRRRYPVERLAMAVSVAVAVVGAFWFIQRVFWA